MQRPQLNSPGTFESISIELVYTQSNDCVVGYVYHHLSSIIPSHQFIREYHDPILNIIAHENKTSAIVSDFYIDLLKYDKDIIMLVNFIIL